MRLDEDACRRRFAAARRAFLGTASRDGVPHLVPVTYALAGGEIFTAIDAKPKTTPHLTRLRNIRKNPSVTLLIDHYDELWNRLWWVRADGTARVLDDRGDPAHRRGVELLMAKYAQYQADPPRGPVILVDVRRWSGWAYGG